VSGQELHVIFGAGPVGQAIMDALIKRGKRVRISSRNGRIDAPLGVEVVKGDASNPTSTRAICEGATVVYNCTNPPYTQWPELFPLLQAGVLEGAATAGAKLIAMENLYMYGPTGGAAITEDLPHHPRPRKGATRAKMSRDLMAAHRSGKVRVAIGRAADFFGPRVLESAVGERLFSTALQGRATKFIGNPDMPHTYSYMTDIGEAMVILGERDEALGQAWHIPSPQTVTSRQFIAMVYEAAGQQSKLQEIPTFLIRTLSPFVPILREVSEILYEFEEPFIMDHSRFQAAFGLSATPLKEAIQKTVEWFRTYSVT
jgi:nucleoside-diphosphate-sugar epimerase